MRLDQLHQEERLVLVGLYFWVIHADGVVSQAETAAKADLRARLGPTTWDALVSEAQRRFPDVRQVAAACRSVQRPAARQAIYDELLRLAGIDAFDPSEVKLLNWLAVTWGFITPDDAHRAQASLTEGVHDDGFDLLG